MTSSGRDVSTTRWSRRTAWWCARWSNAGKPHWPRSCASRPNTIASWRSSQCHCRSASGPRSNAWLLDIPALWSAPTTTAVDRQSIARLMLERVIITVQGDSEQVLVDCHWAGGMRTQHELRRPVQRLTQLHDHAALLERLRELHADGLRAPAIAGILNTGGWRPPKRRATYTAAMVRELLHRIGVPASARSSWRIGSRTESPTNSPSVNSPHASEHRASPSIAG